MNLQQLRERAREIVSDKDIAAVRDFVEGYELGTVGRDDVVDGIFLKILDGMRKMDDEDIAMIIAAPRAARGG